jgi:hypothetical protein
MAPSRASHRAPKRPRLDPDAAAPATTGGGDASSRSRSSSPLSNPETVRSSSEDLLIDRTSAAASAAASATAAAATPTTTTTAEQVVTISDDEDEDEDEDRPLRTLVNGAASASQKKRKAPGGGRGGKGVGSRTGMGTGAGAGKTTGKGTGSVGVGGMSRTVPADTAAALEDKGADTTVDVAEKGKGSPAKPVVPPVPVPKGDSEEIRKNGERGTKRDKLVLDKGLSMERIAGGVSIDVDEVATLVRFTSPSPCVLPFSLI